MQQPNVVVLPKKKLSRLTTNQRTDDRHGGSDRPAVGEQLEIIARRNRDIQQTASSLLFLLARMT
jgi:hypothetical protein